MPHFPAFIDLRGRTCVVAGAGSVGQRKIRRLLHCRADPLVVVEPRPEPLKAMHPEAVQAITLHNRPFEPKDIQGAFLVVASTSSPEVNAQIGRLCREHTILCNVVDQPELCSLIWPSLISQGDLELAVTTGGTSPALTRRIRQQLEQEFGPEYTVWTSLLKALRPAVIARGAPQAENAALFRSLTDGELSRAIAQKDGPGLLALLQDRLPPDLHPFAREVLHEHDFSL
ncbi:precorrin-2 dehydrogenase/sirohydrochlorin ferrochelatase family protein [Desulfovermiculus halophilus]|uniref:precorrin-2 dehydrogenase/sirohydrochlorin ferrochelatase family protein n=1 Tax=Desulfovermiculus halophilus TaxID=339722 RepID=UPI000481D14C|nr:bifunctional precorrin-2 dehydrogenase/sirohydrochlorin ferrochelatase [Desulfovermiculus halophilus]